MSGASREKGKRGEREWAEVLRAHGFDARRGVQYQGGPDSPDVVAPELAYHFEVKRVETLNIHAAMSQAVSEAREGCVPVVAHRRSRGEWMVTMKAADWLAAVRVAYDQATSAAGRLA